MFAYSQLPMFPGNNAAGIIFHWVGDLTIQQQFKLIQGYFTFEIFWGEVVKGI